MWSRLTKRWRSRGGVFLAALYAFCVIAPAMGLAFADGAIAAHCLTADHHSAGHHGHGKSPSSHSHVHADGTVHSHADHGIPPSDEGSKPGNSASCCGLFCFVAVTAASAPVDEQLSPSAPVTAALDEVLIGRGPERINRPPINLLSL